MTPESQVVPVRPYLGRTDSNFSVESSPLQRENTLLPAASRFVPLRPLVGAYKKAPNFQTIVVSQPTMKFFTLTAIVAALIAQASAHSRVWSVWINGSDQGAGAGHYVRQPPTNDPVKDLTSSNLRCNVNGNNAVGTYVSVAAGGTVTTEWCMQVFLSAEQRFSCVHVLDHDYRGDDIIASSHKGPIRT